MSVLSASQRIPRDKFTAWDAILKATGGQYLYAPYISGPSVIVNFEFDDDEKHDRFHEAEHRLLYLVIKETVRKRKGLFWQILERIRNIH